jgi:quercetin dioxygenase-like cupin family protein
MARTVVCTLVVSAVLCSAFPDPGLDAQHAHPSDHIIVSTADVVWQDGPPSLPAGARIAVLEGNPSGAGAFTMRARVPAGYVIPRHWHAGVERITVISGSVRLGMTEDVDPAHETTLSAGGYFSMPPGTTHYFRTDEEAIIQVNGKGPWGIHYENPDHDPSGRPAAHGDADLGAIRRATERFRDVDRALAEGYIPDPAGMCVTAEMEGVPAQEGGMGIHYFRPDLLGITGVEPRVNGTGTHVDFMQPGVLVYEPQADGSMALVAIENLVFMDAWHAAGHREPPSFMGNSYYRMIDNPLTEDADEAHGFEPHYELHMWLYRENPNGLFTQFNPAVTCEHHVHAH